MHGSCEGKVFVFAELLQKCRLPAASLLPNTSFSIQALQFVRLFHGLTAHFPDIGKGIPYQMLQYEFTFLMKKNACTKENLFCSLGISQVFLYVQPCRRLFCSPNPPPSLIMTESPSSTQLFSQIGTTKWPLRYIPFYKSGCP